MSGHFYLIFLAAFVNLWLGVWVWAKSPSNPINRYFGIFSLAVSTWTVSNAFLNLFAASYSGYVWARLAFAAGSIIPLFFFFFATVFPSPIPQVSKLMTVLFTFGGTIAFFGSLTSLMVKGTTSHNGNVTVLYGPLHPAFGAYFILSAGYSLLLLVRKLKLLKGIPAIQVRYLFLGSLIAVIGATVTNILIPLVFGTSRFSQYGPMFSFVMVAMIAHAIIRHRLMDIRVVIKKGVVYIVAFVVAGVIFTGLIVSSNFLLPEQRWRLVREIFLGLVVAALFHPLKSRIQQAFDRYLYRGSYDYQRTVRQASRAMATMLDLRSLLAHVSDMIGRTIRPETVSVYLRNRDDHDYNHMLIRCFLEGRAAEQPKAIARNSALPAVLRKEGTHLLRDDLRRADLERETRVALEELAGLGGELALPLLKEEQMTGFLVVGPKLSGDPYFSEDLDLLSTLASQAAIAVTNAQLYAEVVLVNECVQNILKTMEGGVIVADVEGRVTLINSAAERMTGLDSTSLRSGPIGQLPLSLADSIHATLVDGVPRFQVETTLAGADGQVTPVVCSTSPFSDA